MFMYAWLLKSDSHRRKCMPFMYAEEIVQSSAAAACQMENSGVDDKLWKFCKNTCKHR